MSAAAPGPRATQSATARRTTFAETMAGRITIDGRPRPIRLELTADLPGVLTPWSDLTGTIRGRVTIDGLADDPRATGTLRVAPVVARRIRYTLDFTARDGRRLRLDGWKSIDPVRPVRSMTRLPATVTEGEGGRVVGEARLRFDIRRDLVGFLRGFRFPRAVRDPREPNGPAGPDGRAGPLASPTPEAQMLDSRWRGQPGRLEVWYTTITDPVSGTGLWLHHEMVAPTGGGPAQAHGWAAVFPPGRSPVIARFGPHPWTAGGTGFSSGTAAAADGDDAADRPDDQPGGQTDQTGDQGSGGGDGQVSVTADRLRGTAGEISWDLAVTGGGEPLYTFPRWAWERELLPAAQVVPMPTAAYDGRVSFGDQVLELAAAPGNTARIYGHGNARRWAWLHADLGDGDVCEVVAAVSMRPGLNRLPPLPFVRLRVGGAEWPSGDPLLAALRMRAHIDLPAWTVSGRSGDRRIEIEVTQPPAETVAVDYADPDGAPAVCRNSERADAVITLWRRSRAAGRARSGSGWEVERRWELHGTAHAEVGTRE